MSSILIVDDMKMMNNGLAKSLHEDDHEIVQAYNLREAIEAVEKRTFDYILLDLILPDGEGEMLLPYVQKKDTRVIVLTTDRDSFRRDRIFGFGVVDYIVKDKLFSEIVKELKGLFAKIEENHALTVLVVDDSHFIRNHLQQLLTKRGLNVIQAINGKEALEIMQSPTTVIDAAIVDLEMPEMDGLSLMANVKKNLTLSHIPVMILTGSEDANIIAKAIKNGVWGLTKKPYIVEELLLKVDHMIDQLKHKRIIGEQRVRFSMYHEAVKQSTLFLSLNEKREITFINKNMKEMLGVKDDPKTLESIIHGDPASVLEQFSSAIYRHHSSAVTFGLGVNGEYRGYVSGLFSSVMSDDDTLQEILLIAQDVTQLIEYEHELEAKVEEQTAINLEQKDVMFNQAKMAAMGEMIGNIAHQWRQPLNALGLLIQDLEDAHAFGELDETYLLEMSEKSMRQINFMSKTIDDFRNFFTPNKSKQTFDLFTAVNNTLDIVGATLKDHRIDVRIEIDGSRQTLLVGYPNELQQVLLNLLNNAKDAMQEIYAQQPDHERWVRIGVDEHSDDEMVVINVEDNGGGIPENSLTRIFEPYYTTKEEGKGTGVGLYMSKMIIEQNMHGKIDVINTENGALFRIALPKNG